jgi:hypothetical protein
LSTGWNIREDVSFFVKTRDDHLWQIYIYDFEGSSTGTYTFAKWDHGVIAGVVDMTIEEIDGLSIVPNPVRSNDHFSLLVESKLATEAQINIVNQQGQQIKSYSKSLNNGLNAFEISTDNMAAGIYYLQLRTPTGQISQAISVK